jgi:UDP-glucose 4-epimerase
VKLLVTGAAGKVGRNFLKTFLNEPRFMDSSVVALTHRRDVPDAGRMTVVKGSLSDPETIRHAMDGVTHVLHLAAVKESPDLAIDVAVKGMFLLLEEFRESATAGRFILMSGDCVVGHIFKPYDAPITERDPRRAYPGCYALTKVIEEVMLEQAWCQYDLDGCILRAPWIMEKDDFRFALAFGPDQFGGPPWGDLLPEADLKHLADRRAVPVLMDETGASLRRNFVHVDDVVSAILAALEAPAARQQVFNIAMDRPVDYAEAAAHLVRSRGYEAVEVQGPFHSNWLDNSKARHRLGWTPETDLEGLIERAWTYRRAENDPRTVWYPG